MLPDMNGSYFYFFLIQHFDYGCEEENNFLWQYAKFANLSAQSVVEIYIESRW